MKFTVSTKPLKNSLNLCIINANVMKFYTKSKLVQITASADTLRINHAANMILSEVRLRGVGDGEPTSIMVDPLLFKNLIATFTAPQIEFEFIENALVLHDGKSSFSLPMLADTSEVQLPTPNVIVEDDADSIHVISKSDWKFIKDYQMYAIGNSNKTPIYNYVWVGESGDVIVGDYNKGLFTHSTISKFGKTCLLTDTIINLFNSLPDGTKIISRESSYLISVSTDGYEYVSEFTPMYGSESTSAYNAEIIVDMMRVDDVDISKANVSDIVTILNQVMLLSIEKKPMINCTIGKNQITFKDAHVNGTVSTEGGPDTPYTMTFLVSDLKSAISTCPEPKIEISPTMNGDEVVGITISSGGLTTVLAGME